MKHVAELADVAAKLEEKVRKIQELEEKLQQISDSGNGDVGKDTCLSPSNVDGANDDVGME